MTHYRLAAKLWSTQADGYEERRDQTHFSQITCWFNYRIDIYATEAQIFYMMLPNSLAAAWISFSAPCSLYKLHKTNDNLSVCYKDKPADPGHSYLTV